MANRHQLGFRWAWTRNVNSMPVPEVKTIASGTAGWLDDAGAACNVNVGDPINLVNLNTVNLAQAGEAVYGIIVGIKQFYDAVKGCKRTGKYIPFGTTYPNFAMRSEVFVVPARAGYWEIDCDDAVTATTQATYAALCGRNVSFRVPGNTAIAHSDPVIDISSVAATNTLNCRLVEVSRTVENMDFATATTVGLVTSAFVKMIVLWNVVQEAGEVASGGAVVGV